MTRGTVLVVCAILLRVVAQAEVRHYEIRPTDTSRLELRVYKTGIYSGKSHLFVFPEYQGTLDYDAENPPASRVSLRLVAAKIKLLDTWLSAKDFKSVQEYALKDMLDAAKYSEITFASQTVLANASGFEVRGTLTFRGVAKPSVLSVSLDSAGSAGALVFRGDSHIKLTDYGLKPPKAGLGLVGTKDDLDFNFLVNVSLASSKP